MKGKIIFFLFLFEIFPGTIVLSQPVLEWMKLYNNQSIGSYYEESSAMTLDSIGNVYITGFSEATTWMTYNTIKYNSNGNQKWITIFYGDSTGLMKWKEIIPYNSAPNAFKVDNNNKIYISGMIGDNNVSNMGTIKYPQNTSIIKNSEELINNYSLFQNYPNPFNSSTNIKFQISKSSEVKLIIYNILGKELQYLVDKKLSPGNYEIKFEGINLPSGVYYYKLVTGNFVSTKRMVLIK